MEQKLVAKSTFGWTIFFDAETDPLNTETYCRSQEEDSKLSPFKHWLSEPSELKQQSYRCGLVWDCHRSKVLAGIRTVIDGAGTTYVGGCFGKRQVLETLIPVSVGLYRYYPCQHRPTSGFARTDVPIINGLNKPEFSLSSAFSRVGFRAKSTKRWVLKPEAAQTQQLREVIDEGNCLHTQEMVADRSVTAVFANKARGFLDDAEKQN